MGEVITAPGSSGTIDTGDILLSTTANQLGEVQFSTFPGSQLAFDDHLSFQLTRTASTGTAPAVGDNPVMIHFEVEYTAYKNR